jgi:hypothetical protein
MIGAGKLLRVWKQRANFHEGLGLQLVPLSRPSRLNHCPGLHRVVFRVSKPSLEANQLGFGLCSMASLGWWGVLKI